MPVALALRLERQVGARPLVPRADVVPRLEAELLQDLRGERRPRAAVAVDDDLGARRDAEPLADVLGASCRAGRRRSG